MTPAPPGELVDQDAFLHALSNSKILNIGRKKGVRAIFIKPLVWRGPSYLYY